MIYIPHPTFNFDEALGGHVIGCVNNYDAFKKMIYVDHSFQYEKFHLLNPDKVYSKFEKAGLCRNPTGLMQDTRFSFLREDGAEFAIRFLRNNNIDVIGYWIVEEENVGWYSDKWAFNLFHSRYPRSYYDFLEWLGESVTG